MRTIAIDFDGVIHWYRKGWHDGTIYDDPIPGAIDAIRALMQHYAVFIHTARDAVDVAKWLVEKGQFHVSTGWDGKFWNKQGILLVTNRKLPAIMYIDDRAVRFTNWPQALADVHLYEQGQHPIQNRQPSTVPEDYMTDGPWRVANGL